MLDIKINLCKRSWALKQKSDSGSWHQNNIIDFWDWCQAIIDDLAHYPLNYNLLSFKFCMLSPTTILATCWLEIHAKVFADELLCETLNTLLQNIQIYLVWAITKHNKRALNLFVNWPQSETLMKIRSSSFKKGSPLAAAMSLSWL